MEVRDTLVRLKKFQADDKPTASRSTANDDRRITRMTNDLDRESDGGKAGEYQRSPICLSDLRRAARVVATTSCCRSTNCARSWNSRKKKRRSPARSSPSAGQTHAITLRSGLSMSSRSVGARRSARLSPRLKSWRIKVEPGPCAAAGLCRVCATTVSHAA